MGYSGSSSRATRSYGNNTLASAAGGPSTAPTSTASSGSPRSTSTPPTVTDPSHPAFFLDVAGAERRRQPARLLGAAALCEQNGGGVHLGDQCRNGFVARTARGGLACVPPLTGAARTTTSAAFTAADQAASNTADQCINNYCAQLRGAVSCRPTDDAAMIESAGGCRVLDAAAGPAACGGTTAPKNKATAWRCWTFSPGRRIALDAQPVADSQPVVRRGRSRRGRIRGLLQHARASSSGHAQALPGRQRPGDRDAGAPGPTAGGTILYVGVNTASATEFQGCEICLGRALLRMRVRLEQDDDRGRQGH